MPVPWKASLAVVELGLWSMLSTAAVVNSPFRRFGGHTIFSLQYLLTHPVSHVSGNIHKSVIRNGQAKFGHFIDEFSFAGFGMNGHCGVYRQWRFS